MSWAFDRVSVAVRFLAGLPDHPDAAALDQARRTVESFREEIEALDYYQRSGLWQQDFEADEAGKLPSGIRRSVLSEDGLYNLLETIGTLYQS